MDRSKQDPFGTTTALAVLKLDPHDREAMETLLERSSKLLDRLPDSIPSWAADEARSLVMERLWRYQIPYLARVYDPAKGGDADHFLEMQVKQEISRQQHLLRRRSLIWADYTGRTRYAEPRKRSRERMKTHPFSAVPWVGVATKYVGGGVKFFYKIAAQVSGLDGQTMIDDLSSIESISRIAKQTAERVMGPARPDSCPYGERTALEGPCAASLFFDSMAVRKPNVALRLGLHAFMQGFELAKSDAGGGKIPPDIVAATVILPDRSRHRANAQNARDGFTLAASAAIAAVRLRLYRDAVRRGEDPILSLPTTGKVRVRRLT